MRFLDLTLPTLAENLALDEALLLAGEAGEGEVLRLWEWPALAVVLGAAGKIAEEVNQHACAFDSITIARRSSGGGTVLLGPGCLLFSLVLRYERAAELTEVRPSYRYILGRIRDALAPHAEPVEVAGISDLAVHGRKVSGNSQQRKRGHLLHHGTLLHDFAIDRVERYLLPPPRQPEYRGERTHREFLTNLSLDPATLKRLLQDIWQAREQPAAIPDALVERLVREKYGDEAWTRRR